MSADSPFVRLISELGQSLGIGGLAPSDEGICQLVFDGRHVVQLLHVGARDQVLLSCRLADHGIEARHAERMARANFLQAGRGVVLCLAPDGRPHMQVALELAGCGAATLCAALEALVDQAERWNDGTQRRAGPSDPAIFLQSV